MCSFVPVVYWLPVGRLHVHDIRERRVARGIECSNTIAITTVGCEPAVREIRDVSAHLRYLRKVRAILTRTTLDMESLLIS